MKRQLTTKKYWYYQSYKECVECGRKMDSYKERRYTPKPENSYDRYSFSLGLCSYCMIGNH